MTLNASKGDEQILAGERIHAEVKSKSLDSDESMASLVHAYRDHLTGYLSLAEMHGQRWILLLCKILVLSLAVFMLLLAGWLGVLTALVGVMMQAGLSLAGAMLLASAASLALSWACWRALRRRIGEFSPSSMAESTRDSSPAAGGGA
ncbi:hypothetical protein [Zhongshania sp.]|jgi:hypothetical protein|uniref:hypothetical protein n=1 Tax=Zhongshania sp. TaxID=1971902 RepID=UPI001B4FFE13|nr:hypothetical protein [Zhongshania sp.]MBQ0796406.1 hypothetical protein [Zhongshania sp.]